MATSSRSWLIRLLGLAQRTRKLKLEMMLRCGLAVFLTVCCALRCNEAAAQSSSAPKPNAVVCYAEDGVRAPELALTDFSPVVSNNCEYEGAGIVRLSLVVNTL